MKRFENLVQLILAHGCHNMIEIGICRGDTAKYILDHTEPPYKFHYYGVDPYQQYDQYTKDVNALPMVMNKNRERMHHTLKECEKYADRITIFETFSFTAVKYFSDQGIDLVFVDGNHTFEYVINDMNMYWPKLKKYGIMALHDYFNPKFPGVKEAVDVFLITNNHIKMEKIEDVVYFFKI